MDCLIPLWVFLEEDSWVECCAKQLPKWPLRSRCWTQKKAALLVSLPITIWLVASMIVPLSSNLPKGSIFTELVLCLLKFENLELCFCD